LLGAGASLFGAVAIAWPPRRPVEFEAVGVVDDAVQDGVAESGLANDLMPGGKGELAGDQQGAAAVTILDELIAPLAGGEAIRSPVVEDEEINPDQHAEQSRESMRKIKAAAARSNYRSRWQAAQGSKK
jgi:hypothetical protein